VAYNLTPDAIQKIINYRPGYKSIRVFVETGTFLGKTISSMATIFEEAHTIELSPSLYQNAKAKFKKLPIHFHLGDSRIIIKQLARSISRRAIWYLDAHWSGGPTAGNENGQINVPLLDELRVLSQRRPGDLIIIDDTRLFGTKKEADWSQISRENILDAMKSSKICELLVDNDRMILYL
jgi:hypothetical protein